jgi:hypothetical protein
MGVRELNDETGLSKLDIVILFNSKFMDFLCNILWECSDKRPMFSNYLFFNSATAQVLTFIKPYINYQYNLSTINKIASYNILLFITYRIICY